MAAPNDFRARAGVFVALEGVAGSGKSTLAVLLADRLRCRYFHTVPAPVNDLVPYFDARARPLPQLVFHLAGALHASDLAREALWAGHAIADRYIGSVVADHAALHDLDNDTVTALITPFSGYLAVPDVTVYLRIGLDELAGRLRDRDRPWSDRAFLRRLLAHYDRLAAVDPRAHCVEVDGQGPRELVEKVAGVVLGSGGLVVG